MNLLPSHVNEFEVTIHDNMSLVIDDYVLNKELLPSRGKTGKDQQTCSGIDYLFACLLESVLDRCKTLECKEDLLFDLMGYAYLKLIDKLINRHAMEMKTFLCKKKNFLSILLEMIHDYYIFNIIMLTLKLFSDEIESLERNFSIVKKLLSKAKTLAQNFDVFKAPDVGTRTYFEFTHIYECFSYLINETLLTEYLTFRDSYLMSSMIQAGLNLLLKIQSQCKNTDKECMFRRNVERYICYEVDFLTNFIKSQGSCYVSMKLKHPNKKIVQQSVMNLSITDYLDLSLIKEDLIKQLKLLVWVFNLSDSETTSVTQPSQLSINTEEVGKCITVKSSHPILGTFKTAFIKLLQALYSLLIYEELAGFVEEVHFMAIEPSATNAMVYYNILEFDHNNDYQCSVSELVNTVINHSLTSKSISNYVSNFLII